MDRTSVVEQEVASTLRQVASATHADGELLERLIRTAQAGDVDHSVAGRRRRMSWLAPLLAAAAVAAIAACVGLLVNAPEHRQPTTPSTPTPSQSSAPSPSSTSGNATQTTLECPETTAALTPQAGSAAEPPLAANPDAALACLTNEPASKQGAVGHGIPLPATVATVLVRLIDEAPPASDAVAQRCAPKSPLLLTRFGYPSGPVDVIESIGCSAGDVIYVNDRGYVLPSLLGSYLEGLTNPSGGSFTPNLTGLTLTQASTAAEEAGETLILSGEIVDSSPNGTVLLQSPAIGGQVGVIVAVHRSTACTVGQLRLQYLPGEASAGNVGGTLLLRDASDSWCELNGPATLTGLTNGTPVTDTIDVKVAENLELSPNAKAAGVHQRFPSDQLVASVLISAEYRDDADGSCQPHWVVPETWRLTLGQITLSS
jgi:hypothetical protein